MPFKTCFTTYFRVNAIFSLDLTLGRSRFGSISEFKPEIRHVISLKYVDLRVRIIFFFLRKVLKVSVERVRVHKKKVVT